MTPVLMSWSGGKDSAVALYELQRSGRYRVVGLMTTVAREDGRIGMHGVGRELLARQARALDLPLHEVAIPAGASNVAYEAALAEAFAVHRDAGCTTVAFGDLFLEDIRAYRDGLMARLGMAPVYPVWGRETHGFADAFIAAGFKATVCSVDLARLDISFAGRPIDANLLADLPAGVDPCGENGEFHSFVHDGPNFREPVALSVGARRAEGGFGYCDLRPA
jgi:uncharacterized protein (TIGR00290 family)